jgi:hypothetical protein
MWAVSPFFLLPFRMGAGWGESRCGLIFTFPCHSGILLGFAALTANLRCYDADIREGGGLRWPVLVVERCSSNLHCRYLKKVFAKIFKGIYK